MPKLELCGQLAYTCVPRTHGLTCVRPRLLFLPFSVSLRLFEPGRARWSEKTTRARSYESYAGFDGYAGYQSYESYSSYSYGEGYGSSPGGRSGAPVSAESCGSCCAMLVRVLGEAGNKDPGHLASAGPFCPALRRSVSESSQWCEGGDPAVVCVRLSNNAREGHVPKSML